MDKIPAKRGRPPRPENEHLAEGRVMGNIGLLYCDRLEKVSVAVRQPKSALIRQFVIAGICSMERDLNLAA